MVIMETCTANCCAMCNISGFPYDEPERSKAENAKVFDSCKGEIEERISWAKGGGKSLMLATVNTHQRRAEKVLISLGFVSAFDKWAYRAPLHSNCKTGVKVYIKYLYKVR